MAINLANNNSLANITALPASITGGAITLISEQTASASATISFTSGIDSTYDSYVFKFINIHPQTTEKDFSFQVDTGTNTNYNQTITSTMFRALHAEADDDASLGYTTAYDKAQGTSFQVQHAGLQRRRHSCGPCHGPISHASPTGWNRLQDHQGLPNSCWMPHLASQNPT